MSVSLNPITSAKLEQFGRRRRRLILARGICSAIASFLVLMSMVALADWAWVLSDGLRWTLSGIGYGGVAAVGWLSCLRLMVHIPDRRELARRVEMAEPKLRENLLSAIELAGDDPRSAHDSPVFRRLLQNRVGRQMAGVDVSSLLPLTLLGRWLAAAVLVVIVCGVLVWVPGSSFRRLITRAILPGANIGRVSRIQVAILQPTPHSLTLAEDETVAVVVEISGGEVDEVTLQADSQTKGISRQPMRARGSSQFAANLSVGTEAIDYRILAGDAVTRKYTIRSRPRPRVQAFHKTYHFPQYSGLEDKTLTEPHGDLIVLEGTRVDLVLELDQDVAEAEIRLLRSGSEETETLPLLPDGRRRLRVTLAVVDPAIYQVHLVAKQTGFENTFSPQYEIRPQPDLVPRVGFLDQQDTTLLLPPNDILALAGMAEDDLPLVGLEQYVSVNGGDWEKIPLEIEAARRVRASWDWDLLELKLRSGDQVSTKLVATDRKGNRGESVPLQVVVSSPDFDPERHAVMQMRVELYDKLADLADVIRQHQESAKGLFYPPDEQHQPDQKRQPDENHQPDQKRQPDEKHQPDEKRQPPAIRAADRTILLDLAAKVSEEAGRILQQIIEILPKMPNGADAYELELAGRVLARIQYETMHSPAVYLQTASPAKDTEHPGGDLQRVLASFDESAQDAERLRERYRDFITHNVLAAIALDLDALLAQQQQLLAPGTPQSWQRLLRQETVAINRVRVLETLIRDNMPRLSPTNRRNLLRYLDWARTSREKLEAATESEEQLATLEKAAASLRNELAGRQNADTLDSRLPSSLVDGRKELDGRAGSLFGPLDRLAGSAAEIGRFAGMAAESGDSEESRRLLLSTQRAAAELGQLHFAGTMRLKSRKTLTQSRPDADPQYAADAGLTRRALAALLDQWAGQPPDESEVPAILAQIAPAYRTLESGHRLIQVRTALSNLLAGERWNLQQITSRLDRPRQWDAVQSGFEWVVRKLREAKFPAEIAAKVDSLRRGAPAQDAARKITMRRYRREQPVGAVYELLEIKAELDSVVDDAEPIMAEARALIAQYAPTIPEMAQRAAEQLRRFEQETLKTADRVSDPNPPDSSPPDSSPPDSSLPDSSPTEDRPSIDQLEEPRQQINDQLDDLIDALVEDANTQDLLTEEGRERARDDDDSMAMVEEPAAGMNRAIEQAAAADQPEDQARDLAQAAQRQEQTAQALDRIAEHFQRLASGEEVAQTRQALRRAERELGIARQMDQRYGRAEELGRMASKSPQALLAELEAQLQENPAMQESLSDISRNALQQAKNSLDYSAEQEETMRRSIERSDEDFHVKKKLLVKELQDVAEGAADLRRTLVAQADYAAAAGKVQQARETLQETQRDLSEAAAGLKDVRDDNVLNEILDSARQMAKILEKAVKGLAQSQQLIAAATDQSIHDTLEQRAARQRDLETGQRRFREQRLRDARNRARYRSQDDKRVAQQVKSAENALRSAQSQVDKARQALQRDPDNESARRNLDRANQRQREARATRDRAKREEEVAQQRTAAAQQVVDELEKAEVQPLTAANPAAELAHRYTEEATGLAEELARRAKQVAAESDAYEHLDPDSGQLAQAAAGEVNVGQDVSQSGEDVARAGRHEQRLAKPTLADQLGKAAEHIEQVAQGEVAASRQELTEAAAKASSQQDDAEDDGEDDARGDNRQALEALASVAEAKQAISGQADVLDEILNPSAPPQPTGGQGQPEAGSPGQTPGGTPPSAESSPAGKAEGELLARTLDELDRALAASPSHAEPSGVPQPGPPSLARAAQAQAAGITRARIRSRTRTKGQPSPAEALESAEGATLADMAMPDFSVTSVNRSEADDWGQLRGKSAEDLTEGRRESVSAEYRQRVETYFRVLAERARKKK